MFTVSRLNHMVLYVRDAQRSARFYHDVMGFEIKTSRPTAAFLRANGSDNHHDLGLFGIGETAPGPTRGDRVGLYHGAWEVPTIQDLIKARDALSEAGALAGQSDHGASLSLYAHDPDGNEFEVFWMVPRDEWDSRVAGRELDLEGELERRAAHV